MGFPHYGFLPSGGWRFYRRAETQRRSLKISERVAIGLAVEAELKAQGERRGRPKQGGEDISQNFGELFGKKNYEIAADKAGFGNAETYRQAKTVVQNASPELVEAELKAQGERRGRPKTAGDDIVDNYPQFEAGQKTREIAAQKAGFGSEFTYRQAKTVVQNASPELVEAELKAQGERRGRPKQGGEDIGENFNELPQGRTAEIAAEKAGLGLNRVVRILCKILRNILAKKPVKSRLKKGATCSLLFGQICPNSFRRVVVLRRQLALFGLFFKQRFDRCWSNQYQVKGELPVNSPEAAGKETREIAAQKAGSA